MERTDTDRVVDLEEGLRVVVEALEDAIAHNVNATANDSAGWTQEDYDEWEEARSKGRLVLRDYSEVFVLWECRNCGASVSNDGPEVTRCPYCHSPR